MEYLTLVVIGVVMGLFGGLLGIGGSVVMIPALLLVFGENQHLYQAAAMICNFFVATSSVIVHKKANILMGNVIKRLVPAAAVGVIIGVTISNSSAFARENSYLLARIFGVFAAYVVVQNCMMFHKRRGGADGLDISKVKHSAGLMILCGLMTGIPAGLLGIGGGIVCVPIQQFLLKMPLKRAISNSAATIACIALLGAIYKNATLSQHSIEFSESAKIAMVVAPGAIVGAIFGGRWMHKLPANVIRIIFILLAAAASYKLLTVAPAT